jgi:hypothetical protein
MGMNRILLVSALGVIIVGSSAFYFIAQPPPQSTSSTSTQSITPSTTPSVTSADSSNLLRIEDAQLTIEKPVSSVPCPPPQQCYPGLAINSFIIIVRNLAGQNISKLQVQLGNATTLKASSTLLPGQVYIGGTTPPPYAICSYQPMTISGILANLTSFTLRDEVLATAAHGPTQVVTNCNNEPLLLSANRLTVKVNATTNSQLPGNAAWSFAASNTGNEAVKMAYVTFALVPPTSPPNSSGYKSTTLDLGALSPGGDASKTMSFAYNPDTCICETTLHVTFVNGTSLDFSTSPQKIDQNYYRSFVISRPGSGVLLVNYQHANMTSPVNVTSLISVTTMSWPAGDHQGIVVTANPAIVNGSKASQVTPIDLQIVVTAAAKDGVYLISYPTNVCPGLVLIVGAQPDLLPPPPSQGWNSYCPDSQGLHSNDHVQIVSGLSLVYLPER